MFVPMSVGGGGGRDNKQLTDFLTQKQNPVFDYL